MKQYRLKKGRESFQVVDGPMAGKKFLKGKIYTEIPPGAAKKFEELKSVAAPAPAPPDPARADKTEKAAKRPGKEG